MKKIKMKVTEDMNQQWKQQRQQKDVKRAAESSTLPNRNDKTLVTKKQGQKDKKNGGYNSGNGASSSKETAYKAEQELLVMINSLKTMTLDSMTEPREVELVNSNKLFSVIQGAVFSDFGTTDEFMIDGDSLIVNIFSTVFPDAEKLVDVDRAQSLVFFYYFEWFIDNLLNRHASFHILFLWQNQRFYKNKTMMFIRNQCIDYYQVHFKTKPGLTFKVINSEWWIPGQFLEIDRYIKDKLFSFAMINYPTKATKAIYEANATYLFVMFSGQCYFDFFVELEALCFDATAVRAFIYTKKHFLKQVNLDKNHKYLIHLCAYLDAHPSPAVTTIDEPESIGCGTSRRNIIGLAALISQFNQHDKLRTSLEKSGMLPVKFYCIYLALMDILSIEQRSIYLPPITSAYLASFLPFLERIATHANLIAQDEEIRQLPAQLDIVDNKLYLLIATLAAAADSGDLVQLFGDSVIDRARTFWSRLPCDDLDLATIGDGVISDEARQGARHILAIVNEKTATNNLFNLKMYSVENDFVRAILPGVSEKMADDFDGISAPLHQLGTTFKDDFHWHNGKRIDPDAFTVQVKETTSKRHHMNSLKNAGFRRYADSLENPNLKIVIKDGAQTTSAKKSIVNAHITLKTLDSSLTATETIKLLEDLSYIDETTPIYVEHFVLLIRQLSTTPMDVETPRASKNAKKVDQRELFMQRITPTFCLVQQYLRHFSKCDGAAYQDLGQQLYILAKTVIKSYDLANSVASVFDLDIAPLDETLSTDNVINAIHYQLQYASDNIIRNIDSRKDTRVRDFDPDTWQVDLLDIVDKNESALICAPTSSGKTFICFYAFEKVLKSSHDGVVVFVAPTKALVNQIYAQILNKYDKVYPKGSPNVVAGIFTRDWRKDIHNCQILITVPQCLEILFLSVMNVSFIHRVRYVIFDEVHMVSSSENGHTWERNLLLNPAPFLALSATIGNLADFHKWMCNIDPKRRVNLIEYGHRFNDLKLHVYTRRNEILPLNPISAIKSRDKTTIKRISNELVLLSDEVLEIYRSIAQHFPEQAKSIDPVEYFGKESIFSLNKHQVHAYQTHVKRFIGDVRAKEDPVDIAKMNMVVKAFNIKKSQYEFDTWAQNVGRIIGELKKRDLLPVIVFVFDRTKCERLVEHISAEIDQLRNDALAVLSDEINELEAEVQANQLAYPADHPSRLELAAKKAEIIKAAEPYFGTLTTDDVDEGVQTNFSNNHLMPALLEGVGVHHSGLNKQYLRAVELLFRQRKIQVCFATGSLALGVNMPCRSVVFAGDSPYLNLMTYRQCAGRSGRRGLENRGHVIFLGISRPKVHRLVNGTLSEIIGNTVISPSLTLSLMCRDNYAASETNKSDRIAEQNMLVSSASKLIDRSFFIGEPLQSQFQILFSLDYLQREGFIDAYGQAREFSGICTHLSYLEPFNFVLVSLLKAGVFDLLPMDSGNPEATDLIIIEILAHLFFVKETPPHFRRLTMQRFKNLPLGATSAIVEHNSRAIPAFLSYISLYRDRHLCPPPLALSPADAHLPPTASASNAASLNSWNKITDGLVPKSIFKKGITALSGLPNICTSYNQLKYHLPSQSFFATWIIPVCNLATSEVNSYLIDFYRHGSAEKIVDENAIRQGDVYPLLQEFSLLLRTIACALVRRQKDHPITRAFIGVSERYLHKFSMAFPNTSFEFVEKSTGNPMPNLTFRSLPELQEMLKEHYKDKENMPKKDFFRIMAGFQRAICSAKGLDTEANIIAHLIPLAQRDYVFFKELQMLHSYSGYRDTIVYIAYKALCNNSPITSSKGINKLKFALKFKTSEFIFAQKKALYQILEALRDLCLDESLLFEAIKTLPIDMVRLYNDQVLKWITQHTSQLGMPIKNKLVTLSTLVIAEPTRTLLLGPQQQIVSKPVIKAKVSTPPTPSVQVESKATTTTTPTPVINTTAIYPTPSVPMAITPTSTPTTTTTTTSTTQTVAKPSRGWLPDLSLAESLPSMVPSPQGNPVKFAKKYRGIHGDFGSSVKVSTQSPAQPTSSTTSPQVAEASDDALLQRTHLLELTAVRSDLNLFGSTMARLQTGLNKKQRKRFGATAFIAMFGDSKDLLNDITKNLRFFSLVNTPARLKLISKCIMDMTRGNDTLRENVFTTLHQHLETLRNLRFLNKICLELAQESYPIYLKLAQLSNPSRFKVLPNRVGPAIRPAKVFNQTEVITSNNNNNDDTSPQSTPQPDHPIIALDHTSEFIAARHDIALFDATFDKLQIGLSYVEHIDIAATAFMAMFGDSKDLLDDIINNMPFITQVMTKGLVRLRTEKISSLALAFAPGQISELMELSALRHDIVLFGDTYRRIHKEITKGQRRRFGVTAFLAVFGDSTDLLADIATNIQFFSIVKSRSKMKLICSCILKMTNNNMALFESIYLLLRQHVQCLRKPGFFTGTGSETFNLGQDLIKRLLNAPYEPSSIQPTTSTSPPPTPSTVIQPLVPKSISKEDIEALSALGHDLTLFTRHYLTLKLKYLNTHVLAGCAATALFGQSQDILSDVQRCSTFLSRGFTLNETKSIIGVIIDLTAGDKVLCGQVFVHLCTYLVALQTESGVKECLYILIKDPELYNSLIKDASVKNGTTTTTTSTPTAPAPVSTPVTAPIPTTITPTAPAPVEVPTPVKPTTNTTTTTTSTQVQETDQSPNIASGPGLDKIKHQLITRLNVATQQSSMSFMNELKKIKSEMGQAALLLVPRLTFRILCGYQAITEETIEAFVKSPAHHFMFARILAIRGLIPILEATIEMSNNRLLEVTMVVILFKRLRLIDDLSSGPLREIVHWSKLALCNSTFESFVMTGFHLDPQVITTLLRTSTSGSALFSNKITEYVAHLVQSADNIKQFNEAIKAIQFSVSMSTDRLAYISFRAYCKDSVITADTLARVQQHQSTCKSFASLSTVGGAKDMIMVAFELSGTTDQLKQVIGQLKQMSLLDSLSFQDKDTLIETIKLSMACKDDVKANIMSFIKEQIGLKISDRKVKSEVENIFREPPPDAHVEIKPSFVTRALGNYKSDRESPTLKEVLSHKSSLRGAPNLDEGIVIIAPHLPGLPPIPQNGKCRLMPCGLVIYFIPFFRPIDGVVYFKKIILFRFNRKQDKYVPTIKYSKKDFHITSAAASNGFLVLSRLPYDLDTLVLLENYKKVSKAKDEVDSEIQQLKMMVQTLKIQNEERRMQNERKVEEDPVDILIYDPELMQHVHVLEYHKPADHVNISGKTVELYDKETKMIHTFDIVLQTKDMSKFDFSDPLKPKQLCPQF
eukprot:gene10574-12301_t